MPELFQEPRKGIAHQATFIREQRTVEAHPWQIFHAKLGHPVTAHEVVGGKLSPYSRRVSLAVTAELRRKGFHPTAAKRFAPFAGSLGLLSFEHGRNGSKMVVNPVVARELKTLFAQSQRQSRN